MADRGLQRPDEELSGRLGRVGTGGQPGGTANFDHPDPKAGIQVTADLKNGEYIINGRKYWPSNAAGWDMKGANVNTVVVRTDRNKGGKGGAVLHLVPRGTPGVTYEPCIDKMGQRLNQNSDIQFKDARVPEENVFAFGNGDLVISKAFTWSGPVAGIAAVAYCASGLRICPEMGQDLYGRRHAADHLPPEGRLHAHRRRDAA